MKLLKTLPAAFAIIALVSPLARAQESAGNEGTIVVQFDEVEGTPVDDFLKLAQLELGKQILYTPAMTRDLRLFGVGPIEVARSDFRRFVEATLYSQNCLLVPNGDALLLYRSGHLNSGFLKSRAALVPLEKLAEYEGRYVVITTTIPLEHVNAQEATSLLQTYFTDPMIESARALSRPNSIVVTGLPHTIAHAAAIIAAVDQSSSEPGSAVDLRGNGDVGRIDKLEKRVQELEKKVAELSSR